MLKEIFRKSLQKLRKLKYKWLSDNQNITGSPIIVQPVLFSGRGEIVFEDRVVLGFYPSPFYYNGVSYLEARKKEAKIKFGKNIFANNNLVIICENSSIEIGNNVLIGTNVEIIDSDFHEIHPDKRNSGNHICKPVRIGNNVFVGSNVRILKGTTIGENSVVANGAIVNTSFPANAIIAGNPATLIRTIEV